MYVVALKTSIKIDACNMENDMGRWYLTLTGTLIAVCLVLLVFWMTVFWITDRQIVIRVRLLQDRIDQQAVNIRDLTLARNQLEVTISSLELRMRFLETRPVLTQPIRAKPAPRPLPVFSRR